ncbi:putative golgin subfamily A member 6-like protein 3 [Liolophura sinensis]|uniref:putative golgin subfamily A member 6-like protein 3 n=1 Tax=Liolophura sinensis TaxID=3198878 RepID=UPI0031594827
MSTSLSSSTGNAVIREEDFFAVANGAKTCKIDTELFRPVGDGKDIVARARSKQHSGPDRYHLLYNNCEHFAFWCRYGVSISFQVLKMNFPFLISLIRLIPEQWRMVQAKNDLKTYSETTEQVNRNLNTISESLQKEKTRVDELSNENHFRKEEERLKAIIVNLSKEREKLTEKEKNLMLTQERMKEEISSLRSIFPTFTYMGKERKRLRETKIQYRKLTIPILQELRGIIKKEENKIKENEHVITAKKKMVEEKREIVTEEVSLEKEKRKLQEEYDRLVKEKQMSNNSTEVERTLSIRERLLEKKLRWDTQMNELLAKKEKWLTKRAKLMSE